MALVETKTTSVNNKQPSFNQESVSDGLDLQESQEPQQQFSTIYRRQQFEKVNPYIVTMSNGDQFITTSLDPEKIQYEYHAHIRDKRTVMDLEAYAREKNDVSYFRYYPMPEKKHSITINYETPTPNDELETNKNYQAYKNKHKKDKGLLELFDLYNSKFATESKFVVRSKFITSNDIFCSKNPWNIDGIYTNINYYQDRECFCKYNQYYYNQDRCILTRKEAKDEDILFFDYKFFLPDDLKISKNTFKKLAYKHMLMNILRYMKCTTNTELTSTERTTCAKHMEKYIINLSYNKIPKCKKKYNNINCSEKELDTIQFITGIYNIVFKKEYCEQVLKLQFEIDNNCVL